MSDPPATTGAEHHDPLAALRQRDFLLFAGGRTLSGIANTLQQAAIAWQVYEISGSALQLGFIGLARFLPALGLSLVGGAFADSHDRKRILIFGQCVTLALTLVLFVTSVTGAVTLPIIYVLVFVTALAASFEGPARNAIIPQLVTRDAFTNALTISSTLFPLTAIVGPAVAGLLIARFGLGGAYGVNAGLAAAALAMTLPLRPRAVEGERRTVSLAAIAEGTRFVWRRQAVLGCMTLDMFAVLFAGATALLPVYAKDILDVGPRGYGLLTSSQSIGALLMSLVLVALPPVKRAGRALLWTVVAFGLATVVFGLSRWFPLSLLAYALTGFTDQVSVVMRQNIIQLSTPDELRGRVTSVDSIFIGASNQIGMTESGFVAAATSPTFAVVSGGLACVAIAGVIAATMPELRRYRIGRPAHELQPEAAAAGVKPRHL